ncbi:MAG: patatin-like phospholipase family protein [Deltaproteobacteria bacterium]|nr:patatin-like phospholipase family protein [Deltaproteobacteria bacterium]
MRFEKRFYRYRGITILQKRDPRLTRIRPGKVALVLAGGAVSGGSYKVGGLRALDEVFACRHNPGGEKAPFSLVDCDTFIGLSAGSVLAFVLSAGINPDEMIRIILGSSTTFDEFRAMEFMAPNWREPLERVFPFLDRQQELFTNFLSGATDPDQIAPYTLRKTFHKMVRTLPSLLPTGIFSTHRLGHYLRRNMKRVGIPNDFVEAYSRSRKELYLTAVDLNRGQMLVFGHDEPYRKVPISEAIRASCALPGWYRPVRILNPLYGEPGEPASLDLVDGGLVRTANVRVAVEKGADLVICYNPFNRIRYERLGRSLVNHGPLALAGQLFRILLGARLDIAKELLFRDETIDADVVFIEPAEDDFAFFLMNPIDYRTRERAAIHGYHSVRAAIQANHERLADVFGTHNIELHPPDVDRYAPPRGNSELHYSDMSESRGRRSSVVS